MRPSYRHGFFIFILLMIMFFEAGFQTSLWPAVVPWVPGPMLWITVPLYVAVYGTVRQGIVVCYLGAFFIMQFSAISFAMLSIVLLATFFLARFVRARIFWESATYFPMICGIAVLAFPVVHFLTSHLGEANPTRSFAVLESLFQALITPPFAAVFLPLYRALDHRLLGELSPIPGVPT
jgi:hypothetical protein